MRYRDIVLIGLLCLPLMGQEYHMPFRPQAAGDGCAAWPNADFCEDFESSVSSTCTTAPVNACTTAEGCANHLNIQGAPDCQFTTTPPQGDTSARNDVTDTTRERFGWDHGLGDRNPDLDCATSVSTCQWRFKFEFDCSANSSQVNVLFIEEDTGDNEIEFLIDCSSGTAATLAMQILAGECTMTGISESPAGGHYNVCLTRDATEGGADTTDGTIYLDTGTTWCSGVSDTCTITNASGTAADIVSWKIESTNADRKVVFEVDNIAFDALGSFE